MSNDATGVAATPNNQAAIDFLKLVYPEGPWVLTAIQTDRKAIETRTFRPSTERECLAWLKQYNGTRNIYWSVNPPLRDLTKKAEREDIKEVAYLHVDVDPRAGEPLDQERERIKALFSTDLPLGAPPPTVVLFSGGGYQSFWKLDEPIPINGDLALAEDAKRYNQQLELIFGGDNCHNIDRIMRLPGTINVPDEKKRKKGRQAELAELIACTDTTHALSRFTKAAAVQSPESRGFTGGQTSEIKISGNIQRVYELDELDEWGVESRIKVIINHGKHPEEPKEGDDSRSSWVFDVCCNLHRCGVPDHIIFAILMDPDWGISESILEKGSSAEKYAIRQIERAKEEVVDPWLRQLNERYAVIMNIGGKCRVVEEVMDYTLNRSRLTRMSFDDFRNAYMNKNVKVGEDEKGASKYAEVGKWWLKQKMRRQYCNIVFSPEREVSAESYNLWKGFAYDARPGDCSLYVDHLKRNVCGNDERLFAYLLGWMARTVQQPGSPGQVAIVLRGGKGVGKSFFATHFGKLFGRHYLQVSNASHLVGNFNAHLRDVVLLFADEAFYARDKKHGSTLKTLITEDSLTIEAKGVDVESSPNYVHLIMASNETHVVPASIDERRYLVLDVGEENAQDQPYFRAIKEQLEAGGYEALLHLLKTYDLTGYEVRDVPGTDALTDQKALSLTPVQEWFYQLAQRGEVPAAIEEPERELRRYHMLGSLEIGAFITKEYRLARPVDPREISAILGENKCKKTGKVKGMNLPHFRRGRANRWGYVLPTVQAFRTELCRVLKLDLTFDEIHEGVTFGGLGCGAEPPF